MIGELTDGFLLGLSIWHTFSVIIFLIPIDSAVKQFFLSLGKQRSLLLFERISGHGLICLFAHHLWILWNGFQPVYRSSFFLFNLPADTLVICRLFILFFNFLLVLVFHRLFFYLNKYEGDVKDFELKIARGELLKFTPPSSAIVSSLTLPLRYLMAPESVGIKKIPRGTQKLMFVSNHSLGGIEMPLFIDEIHDHIGVWVRAIGDHFHFAVPGWDEILKSFGAFNGTREHCEFLMSNGQPILVYPGGGHEVLKKKTDKPYSLMWGERSGFAALAIKHGYTIIPCCTVGTEDMFESIADIPVGFFRKNLSIPLIKPPTPGNVQKIYMWFGNPIDTTIYQNDSKIENAKELAAQTKKVVEAGILEMQELQRNDPDRYRYEAMKTKIRSLGSQIYEQIWGPEAAVNGKPKTS